MIYAAIDNFYLTDEQLQNTPSRKDGIDETAETTLRIYGCDLIQESGIVLKLPQAAMATSQVLFHRFYCKKSFAPFDVKWLLAAGSMWLTSKLEESPSKARQVIIVFDGSLISRVYFRRPRIKIQKGSPQDDPAGSVMGCKADEDILENSEEILEVKEVQQVTGSGPDHLEGNGLVGKRPTWVED